MKPIALYWVGLMVATTSAVAAPTEIRTAAQEGSEPKYVANGNAVTGVCVDIMRAIERVAPEIKFTGDQRWMPLTRIEPSVQSGDLDAACGLVKNKEREGKYTYVEPELFPVKYQVAVRVDDSVQVAGWDDIRKLGDKGIVLSISGSGINKKVQDLGGITLDTQAKTPAQNLEKLQNGRGRFFLFRSPGFNADIRQAGYKSKVKILPAVLDSTNFYLVLGKHVKKDAADKIQKAVADLSKSGELSKIVDRWEQE